MQNCRIGTDIVDIKEFAQQLLNTKHKILGSIFHSEEIAGRSKESLAGLFAAKESLIKTGLIGTGEWLKVRITNDNQGRPQVSLLDNPPSKWHIDISISHTDTLASAVAIIWETE